MDNWQFALVVVGFGTGLAIFIDRMLAGTRGNDCSKKNHIEKQREKARWLTFWYSGHFPNKEEEKANEEDCKEENGGKGNKSS